MRSCRCIAALCLAAAVHAPASAGVGIIPDVVTIGAGGTVNFTIKVYEPPVGSIQSVDFTPMLGLLPSQNIPILAEQIIPFTYKNPGIYEAVAFMVIEFWENGEMETDYDRDSLTITVTDNRVAVPEPASFALLGVGLLGLSALRRGRRQQG
jgi:hypothetical protein